jgi:hypothetical protein
MERQACQDPESGFFSEHPSFTETFIGEGEAEADVEDLVFSDDEIFVGDTLEVHSTRNGQIEIWQKIKNEVGNSSTPILKFQSIISQAVNAILWLHQPIASPWNGPFTFEPLEALISSLSDPLPKKTLTIWNILASHLASSLFIVE